MWYSRRWCKIWSLNIINLVCCHTINSKDGAEDDVDGGKSKPPEGNECSEHNFCLLKFLRLLIDPSYEYLLLLHVGHLLPDQSLNLWLKIGEPMVFLHCVQGKLCLGKGQTCLRLSTSSSHIFKYYSVPDEVNDCVKDDLKEWHEQVPEEPDFNELDVGRLGEGVGGRDEECRQHEKGCQVCHGDGVELSCLRELIVGTVHILFF